MLIFNEQLVNFRLMELSDPAVLAEPTVAEIIVETAVTLTGYNFIAKPRPGS